MVPRFESHRRNYPFPFADNFRKACPYIRELFPLQHEKCRNAAQPALPRERDLFSKIVECIYLSPFQKKKKVESLAQGWLLGNAGMGFYQIAGKVM